MPINQDVTVTLPGGGKSKVIGRNSVDPIYGNQFIRKMSGKQGGTFESTARGVRATVPGEGGRHRQPEFRRAPDLLR